MLAQRAPDHTVSVRAVAAVGVGRGRLVLGARHVGGPGPEPSRSPAWSTAPHIARRGRRRVRLERDVPSWGGLDHLGGGPSRRLTYADREQLTDVERRLRAVYPVPSAVGRGRDALDNRAVPFLRRYCFFVTTTQRWIVTRDADVDAERLRECARP